MRLYARHFSLSTAVAIAVVRSSNNHKNERDREKGREIGSHSPFRREMM